MSRTPCPRTGSRTRTEGANVINSKLKYEVDYITAGSVNTDYLTVVYTALTVSLSIDLAANAPVMKIADFFSGILKTFNMTTYSITDGEYWVEPLDDWYSKGAVIDVSKYVDVNTIEHARMPLYKKISFKYQDSECFLNKNFSQTFSRSYGDTTYQYNYDGGEFTVEVPFENLLQQKFTGTDLQVGYSLNGEFAPYIPKPVLLYQYTNKTCNFKYHNDGGGHSTVTSYTPFGQDLLYNATDFTLRNILHSGLPNLMKVIQNPINLGLAASSNVALDAARGKYIIRLDADDFFMRPDAIAILHHYMTSHKLEACYPTYLDEKTGQLVSGDVNHHAGCAMFDIKALRYLRFSEELRHYEGLDLYLRASKCLNNIGYANDAIFYYSYSENSMSNTKQDERLAIKNKLLKLVPKS